MLGVQEFLTQRGTQRWPWEDNAVAQNSHGTTQAQVQAAQDEAVLRLVQGCFKGGGAGGTWTWVCASHRRRGVSMGGYRASSPPSHLPQTVWLNLAPGMTPLCTGSQSDRIMTVLPANICQGPTGALLAVLFLDHLFSPPPVCCPCFIQVGAVAQGPTNLTNIPQWGS